MRKQTKLMMLIMAIALILSQATAFAATESYAIEIGGAGITEPLMLSVDDLKAMPKEAQIDEDYVYNSKSGEKTVHVKGVSLAYIFKDKLGINFENAEVIMTASDGYKIDPQALTDVLNGELKYVIAYETDGQAIDDDAAVSEEVRVYRKQKEAGEFGTVYKMVNKITVGEPITVAETTSSEETLVVFSDISEEYKYAETAINELAKLKIVAGVSDGLFQPQGEFNRAQFCKMAVLSLKLEPKEYKGSFSDVKSTDWYASYVQAAVESGLFVGNLDGTFAPSKTITREQIATVTARAQVKANIVTQEKLNKFVMEKSNYLDKASVQSYAVNAVAWLEAQGVFTDIAKDNFEPAKGVNRAEAAVVLYNSLIK